MRISSGVCGHIDRQIRAETLATAIHGQTVLDTGAFGPGANHWRTWAVADDPKADWVLVVEDDAIPVVGFNVQLRKALRAAPSDVVSLYAGTGRPPQYQERLRVATASDAHWIVADRMLHGVGIALRRHRVADLLDFVGGRRVQPYDESVGHWAVARGLKVSYSNPSLLDHADLPTLVVHRDREPRVESRVAWRVGSRRHWGHTSTQL